MEFHLTDEEAVAEATLYRCVTCPEEINCHPAKGMVVFMGRLYCEECFEPSGNEGRRVIDVISPGMWRDMDMARHWIDRYASGVDDSPQMSRILRCVIGPVPSKDTP